MSLEALMFRSEDREQIQCRHHYQVEQVDLFFIQVVRSSADGDFSFIITYREFTAEMLQELISHSLYCSQQTKHDCYSTS